MHSVEETFTFWATVLGTALAVFDLIHSRAWLTGISLTFLGAAIFSSLYAWRERRTVKSATVKIEGRSIDSLNIANLRRRINQSLVIQEGEQLARIEGEDLTMTWRYTGYCRAEQETAMEFSVDSDNNVPFDELRCVAYDLRRDPGMQHKIRPLLVGPDGISKKIAVPFLAPLKVQEPFGVLLKCHLPGCMKDGLEYYTSTLSLGQDQVRRSAVRLLFVGERPEWVRVYECDSFGNAALLKDLQAARENNQMSEYVDVADNVPAQSARIYAFMRADGRGRSWWHG